MGLGPVSLVSLAEARERARAARRQLLDGIDPLEARIAQRQRARLEAAASITFRDCAERYIAAHAAGWHNAVHRKQWSSSLATYCYPVFGGVSVAATDTAIVLKALEPIWRDKQRPPAGYGAGSSPFSIGPRCEAIGRARTRPGGEGISTGCSLTAARFARSSITPRCPTPSCLRSWRCCANVRARHHSRSNLQF